MKYANMVCRYIWLLGCLLVFGCSSYSMQAVYTSLETGNPEVAFAYMEKQGPKNPKLPFLFERGLVAHYANRFPESNDALSLAEDISEDLYTRSVSREALALLTNDLARPYPGSRFERILSHYYRALNYIYLNQLDGALVECRRATNLINAYKGENENYDFFGAGFLAYLSGMCFEAAGEWNDAFISYRQAETYYQHAATKTGVKTPEDVGYSLVRLARKLGFTEEAAHYQNLYGEPTPQSDRFGELILFYESGYVPAKHQKTLTFPILKVDAKNDAFLEDNQHNEAAARDFVDTLLNRRGKKYSDAELEYLLYVAMPTIASNRPHFAGITVQVGDTEKRGIPVGDIQAMAIETFNAQEATILIRSVTRAFLKYLVYRVAKAAAEKKAEKEKKKREEEEKKLTEKERKELAKAQALARVIGGIVNIVNIATEHADTRSWRTLPNQIFIVRMSLPQGVHNINLTFFDVGGQNSGTQILRDVEISPNRITFLNYRTYK